MDEFTKEILKSIGWAVVGLAAFVTVAAYLSNWGNEVQGRNTAEVMCVPHQYSLTTPCMVYWHGQWLPLRSIYKVN